MNYPATLPICPSTLATYKDGDPITGLQLTVAWQRDGTVLRVNVFRRSAPGRGWVASTEDSDAPMSTPRRTQWLRPGPFPERLLCP